MAKSKFVLELMLFIEAQYHITVIYLKWTTNTFRGQNLRLLLANIEYIKTKDKI